MARTTSRRGAARLFVCLIVSVFVFVFVRGHLVSAAAEEGVGAADNALARVRARVPEVVVPHHLRHPVLMLWESV